VRGLWWLLVIVGVGCGGAEPRVRTNRPRAASPEQPLPTEANRNAPPPTLAEAEDLPPIVLWCSQPGGPACAAAQEELGLVPSATPEVAEDFLVAARDGEDDCADPDLGPLMQRLTSALGIAPGQLADQGGQILDARMLEDLYSGPGCTPVFAPGEPPLKIHVVDRRGEPHFLVRVWELGEIAP